MEDFEKRREEYYEFLGNNLDVLTKIIEDNKHNEENKKTIKIILHPKDIKELYVAETIFTMAKTHIELLTCYYSETLKEIPIEENDGVNFLIRIINALKNNENVLDIIKDINVSEIARLSLLQTIALLGDPNDIKMYIAKNTGYNFEDESEVKDFEEKFAKACSAFNKRDVKDYRECTQEELENSRKYAKEFAKCFEDTKMTREMFEKNPEKKLNPEK